ncbi:MAG: hypothetical protein PHU75_11350, partial [Candidatus Nanopelagicales bacterium]|nr:hypothetical protein [Candidatus Nanopelagicales bacterium]
IEVVPEVLALRPSVEGAALAAARRAVEQCSDALVVELPVIDAARSLDAWVPARGWRRRRRRAAGVEQLLGAIDHARP